MIIGIDCSRAFVGDKTGTENYSYYLVKHLLRLPESQKHQFVLFTRPNTMIPDWAQKKHVQIKLINFRFLWTQLGLAWETWVIPLDVLWIPAHTLPILRKPGLHTVVTIHGLEYRWLPEYKNFLQRWYLPLSTFYAAKYATELIAVSEFTKNQLVKELHTSSDKIKVVHEGVEIEPKNRHVEDIPVLARYGLQDKNYILFVGTIQPRKNVGALIAAFSQVTASFPDLKLVLAGGVGWMAEEVLSAPTRYAIQEKVVFTGRVSEVELAALYRGARVYVQPSLTEGFGLPILEAMMSGVPVVVSDGGALPEVVARAGITVSLNGEFVRSLANALNTVIRDKKLQKRLVTMGYSRVRQFNWDIAAKHVLDLFEGRDISLKTK